MRMLAVQLFIGIAVAALPLALATGAFAASVHKKKPGVARAASPSSHARVAHHRKNPSLHKSKSGKFHQPQASKSNHASCCSKQAKTKPPKVIHKPGGVIVRTPPVTVVPPVVFVRPPGAPAPSAQFASLPPSRQPAPPPPSPRGGNSGVPAAGETRYVPDEVVLEIDPRLSPRAIEALARRHALAPLESRRFQLANTVVYRWRVLPGRSVPAAIRALEGDRQVRSAQPNYLFALSEEALANPSPAVTAGDPAQYTLAKLRLPEAHAHAKGTGVIVAVIDSSIDVSHPELNGAIAGRFDALRTTEIPDAHGTGIAGAISARARLLGVAPAARILAVRVFGGGKSESTTFSIMSGIDWASTNGARILNMSFAGPRDPLIGRELAAAYRKGIVLVAASGNAGPNSPPLYPAADPAVIAVTATDAEDNVFAASNRGPHIGVAAPGTDILHAAPNATYRMSSGTSLAAAHVSGIVALLLERQPDLTPDSVRNILFATAVDLGPKGRDDQFGAGRADAYRAVSSIQQYVPAAMAAPPPASSTASAKPSPPRVTR
jgi:subtilisin family serine protease